MINFNHLKEVRMGYWGHFKFAIFTSFLSFYMGVCLLTHAVFPFIFDDTFSKFIKKMYKEITKREY
jgi:hypothetical protein